MGLLLSAHRRRARVGSRVQRENPFENQSPGKAGHWWSLVVTVQKVNGLVRGRIGR
jgi:hypothetical protein